MQGRRYGPWEIEKANYGCPIRQAIIFCHCGYFFFVLFSSPVQRLQIGCLPYFHTWRGLSANLQCRSEMCCMRLAGNTGRKNLPSAYHCTTLSRYIFAITAMYRQLEKLIKQQCLFHTSWQYGELQPTNSWYRLVSLGHPSKFQWVSRLSFVTAPMSVSQTLHDVWLSLGADTVSVYIHFRGLLPPNRILSGAKFTLCPSLAFCYIIL